MFNMFSGGALSRFSLFALNVIPYISASIVIQLLVQIMPSLKAIQKEGESGRRRITQWSRIGAIPLAIFQRSEEHTSELQSLMRISYAVFCLKKKKTKPSNTHLTHHHLTNHQT